MERLEKAFSLYQTASLICFLSGIVLCAFFIIQFFIWKKDKKIKFITVCVAIIFFIVLGILDSASSKLAIGIAFQKDEEAFNPLTNSENVDESETQKELEESKLEYKQSQAAIQAEAIQADYWEINEGNWLTKSVYATGEIVGLHEKLGMLSFSLFPESNDSENRGIYEVNCTPLYDESLKSLKEGDHVKIYGIVGLKNTETGAPQIYAAVIEPIEQQDDNKE